MYAYNAFCRDSSKDGAHEADVSSFLCCSGSSGHEVTYKVEVILLPFRHARTHVMKKLERKVVVLG